MDYAIVRLESGKPLFPLPLGVDTMPGDSVWCCSDPFGKQGYYSEGTVSRFVQRPFLRRREQAALPVGVTVSEPVWLETTANWALGSSGSALVDACGNAVGHVSEIQPLLEEPRPVRRRQKEGQGEDATQPDRSAEQPVLTPRAQATHMVIHQAISIAEVLALIQRDGP